MEKAKGRKGGKFTAWDTCELGHQKQLHTNIDRLGMSPVPTGPVWQPNLSEEASLTHSSSYLQPLLGISRLRGGEPRESWISLLGAWPRS